MQHEYMNRQEAADFLRVSIHTLADWASQQKKGPRMYKIGRRVLYKKGDLIDFIEGENNEYISGVRSN